MPMPIEMGKWKRYRFEKGTRYYVLELRQDLWGEWEIIKINGRIKTALGRIKSEPCDNYANGTDILNRYCVYRMAKRHYQELTYGHYC